MRKFVAVLEYDGTSYHGWQLQKDLPTVQGNLEQALERILGNPTRVHGSGRTDAGVHARGQVIHFLGQWTHSMSELQKGCNALLPGDIAIRGIAPAPEDFHARHSACSKTYTYRILNQSLRSPLLRFYSWFIPEALDLVSMKEAGASIVGSHDFAAFGSPTDGTSSTVREILHAGWLSDEKDRMIRFTICGTGFLRYMVRSLVGTMVRVGRGRMTPSELAEILASCDRSRSGPTAPPQGLGLESVEYKSSDGTRWSP